ncbi:MAG: calcium/sodium antiporter [Planctomycetota bacterium]|jgi:cation:H+ antiporter|nr:calcium/sodium antiporter [Planctomycetota bacterium]MDA1201179.1 calcium/sodium antiporter [Planctomycetota bacterium]
MLTWFWLLVGLTVLTVGAELLVRGAVGLAAALRVSPLVIGLTVVAFGTSAPELVVSLESTLSGRGEIALGNVIGSNVFNVLVILGLSAVIVPLRVDRQLVRLDVPLMIGISAAVYGMCLDGQIDRLEGGLLAAGLISYTIWSIRKSRQDTAAAAIDDPLPSPEQEGKPARLLLNALFVAGGLGLMVVGADWFVGAAVELARRWGLSELVIGLTLVAAGTSLPEVATSVVAAIRGERDLAVGNVVGSNLFNLMCVLGFTGLLAPTGIPVGAEAIEQDLPVMVLVAVACLPVFLIGHTIERWEGCVLLAFYGLYTSALVCEAQGRADTLAVISTIAWVLGPLAVAAYVGSLLRQVRAVR